jgi:Outer membrane protein beta-barrel domain
MKAYGLAAALLAAAGSATAQAQDASRGDAFAAYSMLASDENMHGWHAALGWGVSGRVGVLLDASGHRGTDAEGTDVRTFALMAGPRAAFGAGRVRPFVHAIVGIVRSTASVSVFDIEISESSTDWGGAAGLGFDLPFGDRWGVRLVGDYRAVKVEGETVGDPRVSGGVAYRFGR